MQHVLTALAAKPVPAYCSNLVKTPAQWRACWDAGWSQSTTGTPNIAVGGASSAVLIVAVIVAVLWLLSKLGGSRSPATR